MSYILIIFTKLSSEPLSFAYFSVIIIAVTGIIAYILKLILPHFIRRYFDGIASKTAEFKKFTDTLTELVHEMKMLTKTFQMHKEEHDEFKESIHDKFQNINIRNKELIEGLESKFKYAIENVKKDIYRIDIAEEEHYRELKGKISKQWEFVSDVRESLNKLKTDHDIRHNKHNN